MRLLDCSIFADINFMSKSSSSRALVFFVVVVVVAAVAFTHIPTVLEITQLLYVCPSDG